MTLAFTPHVSRKLVARSKGPSGVVFGRADSRSGILMMTTVALSISFLRMSFTTSAGWSGTSKTCFMIGSLDISDGFGCDVFNELIIIYHMRAIKTIFTGGTLWTSRRVQGSILSYENHSFSR